MTVAKSALTKANETFGQGRVLANESRTGLKSDKSKLIAGKGAAARLIAGTIARNKAENAARREAQSTDSNN